MKLLLDPDPNPESGRVRLRRPSEDKGAHARWRDRNPEPDLLGR